MPFGNQCILICQKRPEKNNSYWE